MHVDHAFVFREPVVVLQRSTFRVEALDRGVQPAEFVAAIDKGRLRKQQNEKDEEDY
jgi:hypothetical protein